MSSLLILNLGGRARWEGSLTLILPLTLIGQAWWEDSLMGLVVTYATIGLVRFD